MADTLPPPAFQVRSPIGGSERTKRDVRHVASARRAHQLRDDGRYLIIGRPTVQRSPPPLVHPQGRHQGENINTPPTPTATAATDASNNRPTHISTRYPAGRASLRPPTLAHFRGDISYRRLLTHHRKGREAISAQGLRGRQLTVLMQSLHHPFDFVPYDNLDQKAFRHIVLRTSLRRSRAKPTH